MNDLNFPCILQFYESLKTVNIQCFFKHYRIKFQLAFKNFLSYDTDTIESENSPTKVKISLVIFQQLEGYIMFINKEK